MKVGIDDIAFYTSNLFLDLRDLAANRGIEYEKFSLGIGQEKMSIPSEEEDIVTMAASAAWPIIERGGVDGIDSLLLATESGIDQSKSAGIFVHDLLNLPSNCRVVEFKQACYSATAALQHACALVARYPQRSVLVIATDVAKYDLDSPGESTQGCGAVAMLVKANPSILEIGEESGYFCGNYSDFWRPNYRETPVVDGKFSTQIYLKAARESWYDLLDKCAMKFDDFDYFCYHLPFTQLGYKAHRKVAHFGGSIKTEEQLKAQFAPTMKYCKIVGNCYTASLYLSFISLLDNVKKLAGKKIAFFSFGSGCMGEFFHGTVVEGYEKKLREKENLELLNQRLKVSFTHYQALHEGAVSENIDERTMQFIRKAKFRFAGIKDHHRIYEKK